MFLLFVKAKNCFPISVVGDLLLWHVVAVFGKDIAMSQTSLEGIFTTAWMWYATVFLHMSIRTIVCGCLQTVLINICVTGDLSVSCSLWVPAKWNCLSRFDSSNRTTSSLQLCEFEKGCIHMVVWLWMCGLRNRSHILLLYFTYKKVPINR